MSENPRPTEPPPDAGPPPEDAESPEAEAEAGTLEEQLAKAREDAQKYLASWQRAEADFQNYKRRVEQEREESRRFSSAALIINTLPIIDDLERALGSLDARLAGLTWFEGIVLIYRKLLVLLDNAGVTPIETDGKAFDPTEHEAVAHVEGEEGKVLSEVQRGYKLHDRVLRPAMVVVGRGAEGAPEQGSGSKEQGHEAGSGEKESSDEQGEPS